jgi:hypothetical protein
MMPSSQLSKECGTGFASGDFPNFNDTVKTSATQNQVLQWTARILPHLGR